jgi:predicted DCC family thiol-disulfide oxidoreductase YuxK
VADHLTVLYDEACGFCSWLAARLARRPEIVAAEIGSAAGERLLRDLPRERRYDSVHVVDAHGRRRSGAEALPTLLRSLPRFGWVASIFEAVPSPVAWGYELVSRHRRLLSRLLRLNACPPGDSGLSPTR